MPYEEICCRISADRNLNNKYEERVKMQNIDPSPIAFEAYEYLMKVRNSFSLRHERKPTDPEFDQMMEEAIDFMIPEGVDEAGRQELRDSVARELGKLIWRVRRSRTGKRWTYA